MKNKNHFNDEFDRIFNQFFNMFGNGFNLNDNMFNLKNVQTRKGKTSDGGYFEESTWTSPDGTSTYSSTTYSSSNTSKNKVPVPSQLNISSENSLAEKIKSMETLLKQLVEREDFENAAKLRDHINHFKKIEPEFKKLREQLLDAVSKEDYEKADKIKKKVENLLTHKNK